MYVEIYILTNELGIFKDKYNDEIRQVDIKEKTVFNYARLCMILSQIKLSNLGNIMFKRRLAELQNNYYPNMNDEIISRIKIDYIEYLENLNRIVLLKRYTKNIDLLQFNVTYKISELIDDDYYCYSKQKLLKNMEKHIY